MTEAWYPPQFYPVMVAGSSFHWETPPFMDSTTGETFDWTAEPLRWELAAEVRDRTGALLARFDNTGSAEGGVITARSDGVLEFDMPASYTAEMPITRPYTNSTDPRISGSRNRGSHAMDLVVVDTEDDDTPYTLLDGHLTVQQPVTGGS